METFSSQNNQCVKHGEHVPRPRRLGTYLGVGKSPTGCYVLEYTSMRIWREEGGWHGPVIVGGPGQGHPLGAPKGLESIPSSPWSLETNRASGLPIGAERLLQQPLGYMTVYRMSSVEIYDGLCPPSPQTNWTAASEFSYDDCFRNN